MKKFLLAALFMIGCAMNSSTSPIKVAKPVDEPLRTPCVNMPINYEYSSVNGPGWVISQNGCGGQQYLGTVESKSMIVTGEAKVPKGEVSFVVDVLNMNSISFKARIIPHKYFGTAVGYEKNYPWISYSTDAKKRLIITGRASDLTQATDLEIEGTPNLILGGILGQLTP